MSNGNGEGGKSAGIPAWQVSSISSPEVEKPEKQDQPILDTGEESEQARTASESEPGRPSTEDVVEQGKRFLLDASIRDAPLEQKRGFLKAQGLSKADIDKAVELSKTAAPPQTAAPLPPSPAQMATSSPSPPPQPQRDIPPIITYPEFLLHSTKPPPIITASRLLTTAYTAAGISTLLYGCNKYLITPLLGSLTESRHDFLTHSGTRIHELNARLSAIASDPHLNPNQSHTNPTPGETDDTSSETSDPTELFHRDYGTQTAPSLIADDDASSTASNASTPLSTTEASAQKLNSIIASCKQLSGNDILDSTDDQSTLTVIRVLHEHLESLAFPVYNMAGGGYGGGEKREDDEVSRFRNEIRSVKGSLLSARNFPGTGLKPNAARGGSVGIGPRGSLFPAAGVK